ncbi:MAG: homocysteine S-methyltransferase family protein [Candidatus Latescibacteria bacterium]|nr:homocysteine S-methyltransferase family protein [Candidatus Latescibacterota bacterium]
MNILQRLQSGPLVCDCAMGTELQKSGLKAGEELGELWNLSEDRAKVQSIHRANVAAGADLILTNTFGANPFKLAHYGVEDRLAEINRAGVRIAREVAGADGFVGGDVGPSGEILEDWGGTRTKEELYEGFRQQVLALAEGGADAIIVETMMDLEETKLAVSAAKEHTDLPVIASMAFSKAQEGFKTLWGVGPADAVNELIAVGADIVGANCGITIEDMVELIRRMRAVTDAPLIAQPNAGQPEVVEGETIYRQTMREMAEHVGALREAGADIIGGCCGTTPEYIREVSRRIRG